MSTAELYLSQDEIDDFIRETKIAPQYFYGEEGAEYGVCPYITFYIYNTDDQFLEIVHEVIELYQELQSLIDLPFQRVYNNKTEHWVTANPENLGCKMLLEHAKLCYRTDIRDQEDGSVYYGNKYFDIKATDQESPGASARWAISAAFGGWFSYTTIKITFRDSWYRKNQSIWHRFVEKWLRRLRPEQCYSGYEIGTITTGVFGAYESDVMERICADYFYGLDVDHPLSMGRHYYNDDNGYINYSYLSAGLRTPTWCFLLRPFWLQKLGKRPSEVRMELNHPAIEITEIPYPVGKHNPNGDPALWIRLGELSLYPVDEGVPELLVLANRLIRPVRCNLLRLYTFDPWEDDPNPRFDFENSPKWMARFDEESEWPNSEARQKPKVLPNDVKEEATQSLQCEAGNPCPRAGYWWTPAHAQSRRRFKQGEILPVVESVTHGTIIWHWDQKQD